MTELTVYEKNFIDSEEGTELYPTIQKFVVGKMFLNWFE